MDKHLRSKQGNSRNSEATYSIGNRYIIGKKIGQGSYASVHLAEYLDNNGSNPTTTRMACKIFDKKKSTKYFLDKFLPRELEILSNVNNRYIIPIHSIIEKGPTVFIFMGYAEKGDLSNFIGRNGPVPEDIAQYWFKQIICGVHYLHGKNIVHRDLKCENILLSARYNIRLADFSFSRYCVDPHRKPVFSDTYCGSAAYTPPEIVAETPYDPKLADVWSLGVILFAMLNCCLPFEDLRSKYLLQNQKTRNWEFQSHVEKKLSKAVKLLVQNILEPNVQKRLTLNHIRKHEWLTRKVILYAPIFPNILRNN